jgi:hypothetical protein
MNISFFDFEIELPCVVGMSTGFLGNFLVYFESYLKYHVSSSVIIFDKICLLLYYKDLNVRQTLLFLSFSHFR